MTTRALEAQQTARAEETKGRRGEEAVRARLASPVTTSAPTASSLSPGVDRLRTVPAASYSAPTPAVHGHHIGPTTSVAPVIRSGPPPVSMQPSPQVGSRQRAAPEVRKHRLPTRQSHRYGV